MRLALLTHEPFYPPSGGGSAEAVYLVREAVRRGHETHVFCPKLSEPAQVEQQFKIKLHQFQTWKMGRYARFRNFKYVLYPFFLRRLVEAVADGCPFDLLVSQHSIAAVTAGKLRKRLRTPIVMNFLDYLSGFMESWPPYLMPRPVLDRIMKFELSLPCRYQADGVMTVSDTLADCFAEQGYPRSRLQPIYYGYDAELFAPAPQPEPPRHGEPPRIVMHGSFDHHHLGDIAFGAIAQVLAKRPEAVFRFVGQRTSALNHFVDRVRRHNPRAALECPGFLPYAEVARQLAGASVGMVPYEESRGVHCAFVAKIVEYVGLGLPVASTPLESARRYFGNEPLVKFSAFDGASLGSAILGWLDVPIERRCALGQPASQRVKAELDWPVISRKALDFLEATRAKARANR